MASDKFLGLAELVRGELSKRNETLALAESCTAGMLSSYLTAVPGASAYFLGSIISYSNKAKQELLNVEENLLSTYGAVSAEVAKAMAYGVQLKFSSSYALSVTGIAGPDGGSIEKPVGTVFVAIVGPSLSLVSKFRYSSSTQSENCRQKIRVKTCLNLLELLIKNIKID